MSDKETKNPKNKEENISWSIPEYREHQRSWTWYALAIVVAVALVIWSLATSNFLFALFIIIASAIVVIDDSQKPRQIKLEITDDGLQLGQKFYDFDEIKNFAIVYKPKEDIKRLYFEFRNNIRPRLSIPLEQQNPLPIRDFLLQYLEEDLERNYQPLSERLGNFFKI